MPRYPFTPNKEYAGRVLEVRRRSVENTRLDLVRVEFEMFQRTGFGRLTTFGATTDQSAGSMTLVLGGDPTVGLDGRNRASVDVTFQGAEAGDWFRDDVPVVRLSQSRN